MKQLLLALKISLKGLLTNKVRSLLTILGIVIGIASVIALMGLGSGAQLQIETNIKSLGTDIVTLIPGKNAFGPPQGIGGSIDDSLTTEDLEYLDSKNTFPEITYISPIVQSSPEVKTDYDDQYTTVKGVSIDYEQLQEMNFTKGKFFSSSDLNSERQIAIIGPEISSELFPKLSSSQIIGESLSISGKKFQIIGLFEAVGGTGFNRPDRDILIPYTTASELFDTEDISSIQFKVTDEEKVNVYVDEIGEKLAKFRGVDPDEPDFSFFTSDQLLDTASQVTSIFTTLLASIAGISLLVGGIGISNIMLVSVTERTREIGLRKAVGARRRDILLQFLIEAVILTLVGGILGIIFGYFMGLGIGSLADIPSSITLSSILLATGVSIGIGIIFGFSPAYKASNLDPIDALRYE